MIKGIILDLDGTLYHGANEVPGAARFVERVRAQGARCLFVTNRSNRSPARIGAHIRGYGIACEEADVLTSSQATALFLDHGSAYVIGEDHLREALAQQGLRLTDEAPDYVVVGFDRTFDFDKLFKACRLIVSGSRFIATNPDAYLQLEEGRSPGTGAIVAAIAMGTGVAPMVVGKPERTIVDMALARLKMTAGDVIMVGDNLHTDIAAGISCGLRTALLLTGISTRADAAASRWKPTWIAESYEALWDRVGPELAAV